MIPLIKCTTHKIKLINYIFVLKECWHNFESGDTYITIWIQITSVVKLMICWQQCVKYSTMKALDLTLAFGDSYFWPVQFGRHTLSVNCSLQVVCLCNCQSNNSCLKLHTVAHHALYRFRYSYRRHAIFNGALCATQPETGRGYSSSSVSCYSLPYCFPPLTWTDKHTHALMGKS